MKNDKVQKEFEQIKAIFEDAFYNEVFVACKRALDSAEDSKGVRHKVIFNFSDFFNKLEKENLEGKFSSQSIMRFLSHLLTNVFDCKLIIQDVIEELKSESNVVSGSEAFESRGIDTVLVISLTTPAINL